MYKKHGMGVKRRNVDTSWEKEINFKNFVLNWL